MGIVRKVVGKAAAAAANSGVVHDIASAAADAIDQSGVGGRAGGYAADILRNPGHRETVIDAATNLATPGVRNKIRAARGIHGMVGDLRGGRGAVSSEQFGTPDVPSWMSNSGGGNEHSHLPPPPSSSPSSSVPTWGSQQPSQNDLPPPTWLRGL